MSATTSPKPRKLHQTLVWLFAAFAVLGVALLAGNGTSSVLTATPADTVVTTTSASNALSNSQTTTPAPETGVSRDLSALAGTGGTIPQDPTDEDTCNVSGGANQSYLPAMRWSDFSLSAWDDGFIIKMVAMLSSIASFFFFIGDLLWKVLFWLTNFGVTFHPLCATAGPINDLVADMGIMGAWVLAPAFIFWFFRARKDIAKGKIAPVIGGFALFAVMFGSIFYLADTADSARGKDNTDVLSTVGTVPWMANSVMGGAASLYSSLPGITAQVGGEGSANTLTAFKDGNDTNAFSCYNFVNGDGSGAPGLYGKFDASVGEYSSGAQLAMMTQLSRIWEQAFLVSWRNAQYGDSSNNDDRQFASRAACRHLESTVDMSNTAKANSFAEAHGSGSFGWGTDQIKSSGLVHYMQPVGATYRLPNATLWASCVFVEGSGWQMADGLSSVKDKENYPCYDDSGSSKPWDKSPMRQGYADGPGSDYSYDNAINLLKDDGTPYYLERGEKDIDKHIGYSSSTGDYRDFLRASIGQNTGTALATSLMAAVVAAVYAWTFGPMAVGLVIVGFALILLLALLPLQLVLAALKMPGGFKLLKLTGTSLFVMLIFGLVLGFITAATSLFVTLVESIVGDSGFFKQVMLAAVPIAVVLLMKKIATMMGMANISSLSGSLGFMSGMAAKAAGGDGKSVSDSMSKAGQKGKAGLGAAGNKAARGLGAAANMMGKKGGPSPLQKLAETRMGKTALGKKAIGGMQKAGDKIGAARDAIGSVAKDRARLAGEGLMQTTPGRFAKAGVDKAAAGVKGIKNGISNMAQNQSKRLAARLGGRHASAAMKYDGLTPAQAIHEAMPHRIIGRKLTDPKRDKSGLARRMAGLVDDDGNPLESSKELAEARRRGLMQQADMAQVRRARRSINAMSPEEKKQYSNQFDKDQVAGLPSSQNNKGAQKQAEAARRHISKIKDPELRKAALQELTDNQLDSVRARQHGANTAGGMNTSFNGFKSELDRQLAQQEFAAKLGVRPEDINLPPSGLVVPAATLGDKENRQKNGAPMLPADASLEFASHPALYLDQDTVKRKASETDDQYSARITAALAARGLVDEDGKTIDAFKARGVDIHTESGAKRAQAWLDGERDAALDGLQFTPVAGERRLIAASDKWSRVHEIDLAEAQLAAVRDTVANRDDALALARDVGSLPVAGSVQTRQVAPEAIVMEAPGETTVHAASQRVRLSNGDVQVDNQGETIDAPAASQRVRTHASDVEVETIGEPTARMTGTQQVDVEAGQVEAKTQTSAQRLQVDPAETEIVVNSNNEPVTVRAPHVETSQVVFDHDGNPVELVPPANPNDPWVEVPAASAKVTTASPTAVTAEIPVVQHDVHTEAISLPANSGAPQKQEAVFKTVTLNDVSNSVSERTRTLENQLTKVALDESASPEDLRTASRSLAQVDHLEREIGQVLEGLKTSSLSRANLAVDHYVAMNAADVTSPQVAQKQSEALTRANKEADDRKNIMDKKLSELFRSTHVAQHSAVDEERRQAMRDAAQQMADIREAAQSLYEEEQDAANKMADEAKKTFDQMSDFIQSKEYSYRNPNRGVVSSVTLIEQQKQAKEESQSA